MFKLAQSPTYRVLIAVAIPGENGKVQKESFTAEFKRVGLDRLTELKDVKHPEVLSEVLVNVHDLVDEAGDAVPFNADTKRALFDIPQAFDALVAGFWNSVFGAKKGN